MNEREQEEIDLRFRALELAILSHGPAPGQDSDRCYTARAKWFLEWTLRYPGSES